MKILLVNKYHYLRGGSETYYFGLAELLRKAGHDVLFFSMRDERNIPCPQEQYFVNNLNFNGSLNIAEKIRAAGKLVYSFEAKKKFSALLRDEKPDIVHINLFHRILTASIVDAAKAHGVPVVFTMHDLNCICPNHTMIDHKRICEACLKGNYFNCVKKVCFKNSRAKCIMAAIESEYNKLSGLYHKIDLYITPSEFYKRKLIESKLTQCPVICMRNFLPPDTEFKPFHKHEEYYLYLGRLSEEKGLGSLLKAVCLVQGMRLRIAGIGPQEEELRNYVRNNALGDRVSFCGFLSGDKLKNTVKNAKCIILPSEWYENGPYSVMEAMAAGKPVIVSDKGGLPEIVSDGKTGFIFRAFDHKSLADCIIKIEALSNVEYESFSILAAKKAEYLFHANRYLTHLEKAYATLIERNVNK